MYTTYIEEHLFNHPRVQNILTRLPKNNNIITCKHYGEVFNPKSQNFRLQKQRPALILAEKTGKLVLPTPAGFGVGGAHNYYFSHMLNCLYDCRYCFLQGMYNSANYVLFINYENFMTAITETLQSHLNEPVYFFSGYDCDSLAYEPISHFVQEFVAFFSSYPQAILELRTKSTNIRQLLAMKPIENCVVAYTVMPSQMAAKIEHKAPTVSKRLQAMQQLQQNGWKIGLRLDPLIYASNYQQLYQELFAEIFTKINPESCHSISMGPLRFPENVWQKMVKLYPHDKLMAQPMTKRQNHFSYAAEIDAEMRDFIRQSLKQYTDVLCLFECNTL